MKSARYLMKTDKKTAADMVDLLRRISYHTRFLPGCVYSRIWFDTETSETMLDELWQTAEYMELYLTSDFYRMMLGALELCSEQPLVRFCDCENMAGMELIGEVMEKYREQPYSADDYA